MSVSLFNLVTLAAATPIPSDNYLVIVDVHDTTQSPQGSDKKISLSTLFAGVEIIHLNPASSVTVPFTLSVGAGAAYGIIGPTNAWNSDGNTNLAIVAGSGKNIQFFTNGGATAKLTLDLNGCLITTASASGSAGFNLPHGAAPTSPVNGDMWTTAAGGLFVRINGATKTVTLT